MIAVERSSSYHFLFCKTLKQKLISTAAKNKSKGKTMNIKKMVSTFRAMLIFMLLVTFISMIFDIYAIFSAPIHNDWKYLQ